MTEAEKALKNFIDEAKHDPSMIVTQVKGKPERYSLVFKSDGSQVVISEGKQLQKTRLKPPPIPAKRGIV